MRYCVFSRDLSIDEVRNRVRQVGGRNIREVPRLKQIFCELTPGQANKLSAAGLSVKEIKTIKTAQVAVPTMPMVERAEEIGMNLALLFNDFRGAFTPPLTGIGHTVAILDSGISKTHESLVGKVVYEENFSDSVTCDDIYNHGTNIAYIIAGGIHGSEKSGIAPGAKLMNLKCLNDNGEGTDEMLINAIDRACDLVEQAKADNKLLSDEMYPNVINLSVGCADDGDPDNPVRVACRVAVDDYGLQVIAAAGNEGDRVKTILLPAVDEKVVAVGGLYSDIFEIWPQSSRGPTLEELIKPDFVCWATNIYVASSEADDEYTYKSGTSFSAPIASALIGLVTELGRRAYGEEYYATWYEIEAVGEMVCIKPEGLPVVKDNAYGFGLPALAPLMRGITGPITPAVDVMSIAVLMIVMMPMIIIAKS